MEEGAALPVPRHRRHGTPRACPARSRRAARRGARARATRAARTRGRLRAGCPAARASLARRRRCVRPRPPRSPRGGLRGADRARSPPKKGPAAPRGALRRPIGVGTGVRGDGGCCRHLFAMRRAQGGLREEAVGRARGRAAPWSKGRIRSHLGVRVISEVGQVRVGDHDGLHGAAAPAEVSGPGAGAGAGAAASALLSRRGKGARRERGRGRPPGGSGRRPRTQRSRLKRAPPAVSGLRAAWRRGAAGGGAGRGAGAWGDGARLNPLRWSAPCTRALRLWTAGGPARGRARAQAASAHRASGNGSKVLYCCRPQGCSGHGACLGHRDRLEVRGEPLPHAVDARNELRRVPQRPLPPPVTAAHCGQRTCGDREGCVAPAWALVGAAGGEAPARSRRGAGAARRESCG